MRQWQDDDTGLYCIIGRNDKGTLYGYVGVPEGHPVYGYYHRDVTVEVHGGLTYSSEGGYAYWFGFSTDHPGDVIPNQPQMPLPTLASYKDMEFVAEQVLSLAKQLAVMDSPNAE